jgi:hypothetical protein
MVVESPGRWMITVMLVALGLIAMVEARDIYSDDYGN